VALTDAQRPLGAVLRKVIHEYGSLGRHLQPDFTDASWVSFRFAELLPLSRDTQQHLLEIDDPAERLELLAPMIDSRQL
jgi:Lon protease-like protein